MIDTEDYISEEEQLLLDMLENDAEHTAEQTQTLLSNPTLAADYILMRHTAATINAQQREENVATRLVEFKQHHNDSPSIYRRRTALWTAAIAVAAAIVCLVVFWPTAQPVASPHQQAGHIFTADNTTGDISVTTGSDSQPLASVTQTTAGCAELDMNTITRQIVADDTLRLMVPTGRSAHMTLPDGSDAWLYPGSVLKFPKQFRGATRCVQLEGQAHFHVRRDTGHPFIVMSKNIETRVLGTEFVVSAYADQPTQVTLINGSVRVEAQRQKVTLTPGKQAQLCNDGTFSLTDVDTETYMQWLDGILYFDNATLSDILVAIGRSYNVCVVCQNPELLNRTMRFMADRNQPLESVIQRLNSIGGVKAKVEDNKITVVQ